MGRLYVCLSVCVSVSECLWICVCPCQTQSIARCHFLLSRRDREFLPFSLMLRDEIENFFPSVSGFETRSRISSLRSHAPRRDREFLSSLSCFETRPKGRNSR